MQILDAKEKCSGCHACFVLCPQKCITMQPDVEGFVYPEIDEARCVSCGACKKVCPGLQVKSMCGGKAYACIGKDENLRAQSSSGGVFSLLAKYVLKAGGVVYGAAFDDNLCVSHMAIENEADIEKLRGSKYVQSRIGDCYIQAKEKLEAGKLVLFSGTPCQISGLKAFLGKEYENLILQDIICHGVPSPGAWKKWLAFQAEQKNSAVDKAYLPRFRDKKNGWRGYCLSVRFNNGQTFTESVYKNAYLRAFSNNLSLRPSCYQCRAKGKDRESDITLADFWGVEKILPAMDDNMGTSLVLINSKKGQNLFDAIREEMTCVEVEREAALSYNASAYQSAPRPKNREQFFELLDKTDFAKAVDKCVPKRRMRKYIAKAKRWIKRMCKRDV